MMVSLVMMAIDPCNRVNSDGSKDLKVIPGHGIVKSSVGKVFLVRYGACSGEKIT